MKRVQSEHIVQFFDTDESRAQNAATFLAEGYAAGDALLVIARPVNWAAMIERLEQQGMSVRDAAGAGLLLVQDAADTLRRLAPTGTIDARAFRDVIARPASSLVETTGRRIRAYGEMVDMLAQRGELNEAMALEVLWTDLSARIPMSLLCGYSAAHFVSTSTHTSLLDICQVHSSVHRHHQDPLAAWVLNAAHNHPAGGSSLRH